MSAKGSDLTKLVWIDLETTGLDSFEDEILEIAVVVTAPDLTFLGSFTQVLTVADYMIAALDPFVADMHTKNGLLAECAKSTKTAWEAEKPILEYLDSFNIEPGTSPLAGSTVHFDRAFLKVWMPTLEAFFHYRNCDISSVQEFMNMWLPGIVEESPRPREIHRALPDLEDSIAKARYYRQFALGKIVTQTAGW